MKSERNMAEGKLKHQKKSRAFLAGLFWVLLTLFFAGAVIYISFNIYDTELMNTKKGLNEDNLDIETSTAIILRNRGWFLWATGTFAFAVVGIALTIWGRAISMIQNQQEKEANTYERYEKAANMLTGSGEESIIMHMGGCIALIGLAKYGKNMGQQCIDLLIAFINERNLSKGTPKESEPEPEQLDIKEAIKAISEIFSDCTNISFRNKNLSNINMAGINFSGADFTIANLSRTNLQEAELKKAKLEGANLTKAKLQYAKLQGAKLQGAVLEEAKLEGVDLRGADLQSLNLQGENLQWADLRKAKLQGINFMRADLREADLRGAKLRGAELGGANLQNAKLQKVDLRENMLPNADLQGAYLQGAKLQWAMLREADLQDAKLHKTNFFGADITQAIFFNSPELTKKQILSAQWGILIDGTGGPPILPDELMKDEDIKKWLKTEDYDYRDDGEEEYNDIDLSELQAADIITDDEIADILAEVEEDEDDEE